MKGRTFGFRQRQSGTQRLDPRSAKGPNRFPASEAANLRGPGMLPREDRHQVPDLDDEGLREPRKRPAASSGRSSPPPVFEGNEFEGFEVRRVNLSKAPLWQLKQVDNTEFDEGWRRTLKIMEEWEARTAHIPSFNKDTPEVCSDSPCSICLQKGHSTCACPYNVSVPYGATVSSGYEIVCKACGRSDDLGGYDYQHTLEGVPRGVVVKFCIRCHTIADHWSEECRMKKKSRKQGEFGSTSEQGQEHWQQ